jgi:hypothetical protein
MVFPTSEKWSVIVWFISCYPSDISTDQKVHDHTRASVQKRDPSIQQRARDYNKLCDKMQKLISEGKAPSGAIVPEKVIMTGLFALDVDDAIWQDIGLADEESADPPLWLCNDAVRSGIKARLELDRCLKEEARLVHERRALQVWFSEEWKIVTDGCQATGA